MTNLFDPATPTGKMLRAMWHEVQVASERNAVAAAKADPEKHKLSKLIADNKSASYHYYPVKYRRAVRWCWANNPNIAGYYLSWRQVETQRTIKRTQFKAHKHRYLGEMRCREKSKAEVTL
jgi:hypothetical protein